MSSECPPPKTPVRLRPPGKENCPGAPLRPLPKSQFIKKCQEIVKTLFLSIKSWHRKLTRGKHSGRKTRKYK